MIFTDIAKNIFDTEVLDLDNILYYMGNYGTPESAVFLDVFVLALLGQSMLKQEQVIWGLSKSPKDIWCECVAHCCMPPLS